MNRYHIVTPLARLQNLELLIENIKSQRRPQFEIVWHPILDEGLPFDISFSQHWVQKGYCPRAQPFWSFWAYAMNRFIDALKDTWLLKDRFCVLNDDDAYEPGFFEHIDKVEPGDLMIVSMKRGHHTPTGVTPDRAHGTNTLEAKPESMQVGHVGAEQIIASGGIWMDYAFNNTIAADGERICEILKTHTPVYVPDAFVWFNYFEPGRWDKP